MQPSTQPLITDIRAASRELVREFGLMSRTVADTDLSLSAVNAIIETGRAGGLSAKDLSDRLRLEKSTVSRLVKSLIERGQLREQRSERDRRMKLLYLTQRGQATLRRIDNFAEAQVGGALERLDEAARHSVLRGLRDYAGALRASSVCCDYLVTPPDVHIATGYAPTLLARMVEIMHGYMHEHFGFGLAFEARIATDFAEFLQRVDSPANRTWRAEADGRIVGVISIDGEDLGDGLAHLRWFAVDGGLRGAGVGNRLLTEALEFCDRKGYRETHLWTVRGLDAARSLYERHGFELAEQYEGDQWGSRVLEHRFVRPLPAAAS